MSTDDDSKRHTCLDSTELIHCAPNSSFSFYFIQGISLLDGATNNQGEILPQFVDTHANHLWKDLHRHWQKYASGFLIQSNWHIIINPHLGYLVYLSSTIC